MACCLQRRNQNPIEHLWYSKAMNNFYKKLHLRCLTSFWMRLWSKTFREGMQYLIIDILCCKSHFSMYLKKRKHFTLKREGSFLVSLFFCFSLQTKKDSALVELCNAALWRFFKSFSNFAGKRLWCRPLLVKF